MANECIIAVSETDPVSLHREVYARLLTPDAKRTFLFAPVDQERVIVRGGLENIDGSCTREVRKYNIGDEVGFTLRAAPRHKVAGKKKSFSLGDKEGRLNWLARRAVDNGFEVIAADVKSRGVEIKGKGFFDECVYTGRIRVVDSELFSRVLNGGIGQGRAYGFGLLRIF